MLFSKHFLAVSGAVRIYQRTSDPLLLQSRIDIVESVILIILNSKYSQPMNHLLGHHIAKSHVGHFKKPRIHLFP